MRIFVTGGRGFVGRHLVSRLREDGHEVEAPEAAALDLRDQNAIFEYSAVAYDRIYHLAAWTRAGRFCETHGGDQWIVNQQINTNVLAWWAERQPQARMVAFGTSASYAGAGPHAETSYMLGEPSPSYYAYAMTKRILYSGLIALSAQSGLEYLYMVPSMIYGPGYHTDGRELHFIYDLARKIARGKRFGEPVVLWGDGSQRRELIYIDDFVDWVIRLPERAPNDIVNLGEGGDHTIRDLATRLCRVVGLSSEAVEFDTNQFVGARTKQLDTGRLATYLPDRMQTPLDVGLERTMRWVEEHLGEIEPAAATGTSAR